MPTQSEGPELVKILGGGRQFFSFEEGPSKCKISKILLWFEPEPFSM